MKIVILGAGQVGSSVARQLVTEGNEITIIDNEETRLEDLRQNVDLRTIVGNASHPEVLERAGIEDAEMLIAVTNSDEVNMIACQVAHTLYYTPTKIARIRSPDYLRHKKKLFTDEVLPIDVIISPEMLIIEFIRSLIEYPGASQVLDFADGKVQLVGVKAHINMPMLHKSIGELKQAFTKEFSLGGLPLKAFHVAAIFRREKSLLVEEDTIIEPEDEIFFLAEKPRIRSILRAFHPPEHAYKRIMIGGGGNIGKGLAKTLENRFLVKLIERNAKRAHDLEQELNRPLVLIGDVTDERLLDDEYIRSMDVFCAITNDEDANILSAFVAKRLSPITKVMALVNSPAYTYLTESGIIDVVISPQQISSGALLTHMRRGHVVAVHSLRRGTAEAMEVIVHGNKHSSRVVGREIGNIKLPHGTSIGAVVRGYEVIMPQKNLVIHSDDHLILFLSDKSKIPEVEKLFAVNVKFI